VCRTQAPMLRSAALVFADVSAELSLSQRRVLDTYYFAYWVYWFWIIILACLIAVCLCACCAPEPVAAPTVVREVVYVKEAPPTVTGQPVTMV